MIVVLSGEGPSDLGCCINGQGSCLVPDFQYGPMTHFVDKELESLMHFSLLGSTPDCYRFVSKSELISMAQDLRQNKKTMTLKGKKRPEAETGFFYINALMLGKKAIEIAEPDNEAVMAVLFRDSDGTRSSDPTLWQDKVNSIHQGFRDSALGQRGAAMVPKPKSESWMLCVLRDNYHHCARLEELSGNDDVDNSAKQQLERALNGDASTPAQLRGLENVEIDTEQLAEQMPSYNAFRQDLITAYRHAAG